jgi:hypothetical protein
MSDPTWPYGDPGLVRNEAPHANHDGWMTVVVPHDVNTVFVEWAPEHTPDYHVGSRFRR